MNVSGIKILLVGLFLCSFQVQAMTQPVSPYQSFQQIRQGLQSGNYEALDADQKAHFSSLLEEARDILFSSPSSQVSFICVHQGNGYYSVTNTDTGKAHGSSVYGLDECKKSLPSPGTQYACVHQGNGYYSVENLISNKVFGSSIYSVNACKAALPVPGKRFACVHQGNNYWQGMNLQTGVTLGSSVYSLEACKAQLP